VRRLIVVLGMVLCLGAQPAHALKLVKADCETVEQYVLGPFQRFAEALATFVPIVKLQPTVLPSATGWFGSDYIGVGLSVGKAFFQFGGGPKATVNIVAGLFCHALE